ncbi:hypothetical protein C8R43DRAFT_924043 [Mycena crocata]|nr:hypothetical protein C8R43DRAFT_924043 [Mycena crocata]
MSLNPSFRALTNQEKIDIKRTSGKAPCAECKRLKLKCDKTIPCASCVRRGCGETCPTGTYLPTGRGKRAVPTEASRLKRTIAEMESRMKDLETAITRANSFHLDYCPYLGILPPDVKSEPADELADSLGSLTINESGDSQYFGPTAGAEVLLAFEVGASELELAVSRTSTFAAVTDAFPAASDGTGAWDPAAALTQLRAHLPPKSRAWALCEVYFENGCWSGTPIMRDELVDLLAVVYSGSNSPSSPGPKGCSVHELAVLYIVFALAALVDLTLPPYNAEAEHYFDLGRAALAVRSVFDAPEIATVQALVLVSVFYSHGGPRFSLESAWTTISMASSLCQTMGLHRGRLQPDLSPKQLRRRRTLFWETYSIETMQGLAVGRPTGTCLANISCPFPTDDEQHLDHDGGIRCGYYRSRWEFVKQVAGPVMDMCLTVNIPPYEVIVELDQRIRKFMHSSHCTNLGPDDPLSSSSPSAYFQRRTINQMCTYMLLYIHNNAFVRAIQENPDDPYYTTKATSFLSAYRYASEIIRGNIETFKRHPELSSRWWPIWKPLFNAAMIVGAVALNQNPYAPQALLELFVAVDLFEGGAVSSFRARSALNVLRRLRDKALASYTELHSNDVIPECELATIDVLAGQARVVAQSIIRVHRCVHPAPKASGPPPTFDRSLVEYFSTYGRPEFETTSAKRMKSEVDLDLDMGATANFGVFGPGVGDGPAEGSEQVAFAGPGGEKGDYIPAFFLEEGHDLQWTSFINNL